MIPSPNRLIVRIDGLAEFVAGIGDRFDDVEEAGVQLGVLLNGDSPEDSTCTDMRGSTSRETRDFLMFLVYSYAA